jgi:hypothetical protein
MKQALNAEVAGLAAIATAQIAGVAAVPEPGSICLLGIAAAGLIGRRHRQMSWDRFG